MIKFKTLSAKNILSIGNDPVEVQFKQGLNIIFGVNKDKNRSNGSGKCVRGSTSVDIHIDDPEIRDKFIKFTNKYYSRNRGRK